MEIKKLQTNLGNFIEGPILIIPSVIKDERGFFYESWNQKKFNKVIGKEVNFVQDNHSKSSKSILRGLHYQINNAAQGKLVRCTSGIIFDVAVDIRISSPTFKEYVGIKIDQNNKFMFWIPEGFAHGFLAMSENVEVQYKTNEYWSKEHERIIKWDDPSLEINWPLSNLDNKKVSLSDRDRNAPLIDSLNWDKDLFN